MQNISFLDVQIEDLELEIAKKNEENLVLETESVFAIFIFPKPMNEF